MSDKETAPWIKEAAKEIWPDKVDGEWLRPDGDVAKEREALEFVIARWHAVECRAPAPQPCGCCSEMLTELVEFTKCPADEDVVEHVKKLLGATPQVTPTHCHADSDGDCEWEGCPQKQKREIYCRLAAGDEDGAEESAEKNTDGRH